MRPEKFGAEFCQTLWRAKKGPNFWKVCFPTLLPLNFTFPTDTNKDNFVSNGKKTPSKRGNCYGADLFPQRPNFSAELARKVCQELATLWEPMVASSNKTVWVCAYTASADQALLLSGKCQLLQEEKKRRMLKQWRKAYLYFYKQNFAVILSSRFCL